MTDELDLAAVHAYTARFLQGLRDVPVLGSREWCALDDDDRRKHAAIVVAALARLTLPIDVAGELQHAAETRRDKAVAEDISAAADWSSIAKSPTHEELERRRAEPAPMHCADHSVLRSWVATGSSDPATRREAA